MGIIEIILSFGALVTCLIGLWKAIIVPVVGSYKSLNKIYTTLEAHLPKIVKIANELEPNGGHSIKDILNRIDKNTQGSISRIWTLLESSEFGYFETDKEGKWIRANKAFFKLANSNIADTKGNGWINSVSQYEREEVYESWQDAVSQKRPFSAVYTMNSGVKVKADAHPISTELGEVLGWLGYLEVIK